MGSDSGKCASDWFRDWGELYGRDGRACVTHRPRSEMNRPAVLAGRSGYFFFFLAGLLTAGFAFGALTFGADLTCGRGAGRETFGAGLGADFTAGWGRGADRCTLGAALGAGRAAGCGRGLTLR